MDADFDRESLGKLLGDTKENLVRFKKLIGNTRTRLYICDYFEQVISTIDYDVEVRLKYLNMRYQQLAKSNAIKYQNSLNKLAEMIDETNKQRELMLDLIKGHETSCLNAYEKSLAEYDSERTRLNDLLAKLETTFSRNHQEFTILNDTADSIQERTYSKKLEALEEKLSDLNDQIATETQRFESKIFMNKSIFYSSYSKPNGAASESVSVPLSTEEHNSGEPSAVKKKIVEPKVGRLILIENLYLTENETDTFKKCIETSRLNRQLSLLYNDFYEEKMTNFKRFLKIALNDLYSKTVKQDMNQTVLLKSIVKLNHSLLNVLLIIFENLEKLIRSNIIDYNAVSLRNMVKILEEFNLKECGIDEIERNSFAIFGYLKKLYLSNNSIFSLNKNMFNHLASLKILDLSANHLVRLEANQFEPLVGLTELDLKFNQIYSIHPNTFDGLFNLKVLNLWNNRMQAIPLPTTSNDDSITSEPSFNKAIYYLSDDHFPDLKNLTALILSNNNLKYLNENQFRNLPSLLELNLQGNEMEKMSPRAFTNLGNLVKLNLCLNSLNSLQANQFENLTSLEDLYLSGNYINLLEASYFTGLRNLKHLNISYNLLTQLSHNILESLSNLNELVLDDNQIKIIERNAFKGLSKLKSLSLMGNQLEELHEHDFEHLTSLESINLNKNQIAKIARKTFNFQKDFKLKKLGLFCNPVTAISSEFDRDDYECLNLIETLEL